jgi:hypothetical protein
LLSPAKFKPELCKLIPRHVAKTNTTRCTMSRREISLRSWYRLGAGTLRSRGCLECRIALSLTREARGFRAWCWNGVVAMTGGAIRQS